jgi:hypothetical protein
MVGITASPAFQRFRAPHTVKDAGAGPMAFGFWARKQAEKPVREQRREISWLSRPSSSTQLRDLGKLTQSASQ